MLTALALIFSLILLVFIHELGHFIAAKQAGIRVEEFGFGFPPRMFGIKKGETLYSVNWLPLGGFVRIYGESKSRLQEEARLTGVVADTKRSFAHQSLRARLVVIAAGISINFIAGWLLLSLSLMIGARQSVVITDVQNESPAAAVGLLRGDEVRGFATAEEFVAYTAARKGTTASITISRGGEELIVAPLLRADGAPPLGAAVSDRGFARLPFFTALGQGMIDAVKAVAEIFVAFGRLIGDLFGHARIPDNIVGPVGIFGIAGDLGQLGVVYLLQLVAMISLNLAALNAIPFPALDGGRILFLLIEKVKGSPLHPQREFWANLISFSFLILLMIIITGKDIARLF
jgi:regulator of sigma E protease